MDNSRNYTRRLYLLEQQVFRLSTQLRLGFSSIEGGYIDGYDGNGDPTVVVGELPDGTTGSIDVGGPPPPRPTGFTIDGGVRALVANWAGTFENDVPAPLNLARLEIHVGTSPTFIPDLVGPTGGVSSTMKGTIETPRGGGLVIGGFDPPGGDPDAYPDYFAVLVARSTSGKYSEPSEVQGPIKPIFITKIEMPDFSVSTEDLDNFVVTTDKLANGAVRYDKVAADAILAVHIQSDVALANKLSANMATFDTAFANVIKADMLFANSAFASKLAATMATFGSVFADVVTADMIHADAIDGFTITGAYIRSTSGGNRVEISSSGAGKVIFYTSSGQVGYVGPVPAGLFFSGPGAGFMVLDNNGLVMGGGADIHSATGLFDDSLAGGTTTDASVNNNGRLIRTPSTRRVKENIVPLTLEECMPILDFEAVRFNYIDRDSFGSTVYPGGIAEQLHEIGGNLWVNYDDEDLPSGIRMAELIAPVIRILRDVVDRVALLENAP